MLTPRFWHLLPCSYISSFPLLASLRLSQAASVGVRFVRQPISRAKSFRIHLQFCGLLPPHATCIQKALSGGLDELLSKSWQWPCHCQSTQAESKVLRICLARPRTPLLPLESDAMATAASSAAAAWLPDDDASGDRLEEQHISKEWLAPTVEASLA